MGFQYEHDATGGAVEGDISGLIDAAQRGGDIKISFGDNNNFHACRSVFLGDDAGETVVICSWETVSLLSNSVNPVFRNPPYRTFIEVNTKGYYSIARASIYGGAVGTNVTVPLAVRWYVRR